LHRSAEPQRQNSVGAKHVVICTRSHHVTQKLLPPKLRPPRPARQRLSVDSTARTSSQRQRGSSCQRACHELSNDVLRALFASELRMKRAFVHIVRTVVLFFANRLLHLNVHQP
jgi:hypothetical protein